MNRKRFKHQVFTFCHMFCSLQLFEDIPKLEKYSEGKLELDILNVGTKYNDNEIAPFVINEAIHNWFLNDLKENNIPASKVDKVILTVNFKYENINESINLTLECNSILVSEKTEYFCEFESEQNYKVGMKELSI